MFTENDLREAIAERANRAPTKLSVSDPATAKGHHTRWRVGIAVAAAAVVVAAVAVTPALLHGGHSSKVTGSRTDTAADRSVASSRTATPKASLPLLMHASTWVSYSGTDAVADYASVEAQYIELRDTGTPPTAYHGVADREVTAYAPGLFTKSLIKNATPITIDGSRGYFGAILPWYNDDLPHAAAHPRTAPNGSKYGDALPAVVWKIGTDQWVSVVSTDPSEDSAAALQAIARKVHVLSVPLRTPIKIGYLPPKQKLSEVDTTPFAHADGGPTSLLGFRTNLNKDYYNWDITITPTPAPSSTGPGSGGVTTTHSVYPVVRRTMGSTTVTIDTRGAISKAQAKRVLASITLAPNPSSPDNGWFTLREALP